MSALGKLPYVRPQVFRHDVEIDEIDWIREAVNEIRRMEGLGPHDRTRSGLAPAGNSLGPMLVRRKAN